MEIHSDGKGQPYIEWEQLDGVFKRAWIQTRTGDDDWAGTGRYLNVVRCTAPGRTGGNPTDFPIFNDQPSEHVLIAFVPGVNALTGCKPWGDT